jgi:DNA-binding transcriptional LysR family regulator
MRLNVARFDLVSIRLVILCAEAGTLSAAAKRAHCTLSAASQRLSALERAIGARLFYRGRRGLRITHVGERFICHAKVIFEHLDMIGRAAEEAHCSEAKL